MTEIKGLRPVKYDPRTDIIEPGVQYDRETLAEEISSVMVSPEYGGGWEVVEPVAGWGGYTHLIRVIASEGGRPTYYLAALAGEASQEDRIKRMSATEWLEYRPQLNEFCVMPRGEDTSAKGFMAGVYQARQGHYYLLAECYSLEFAEYLAYQLNKDWQSKLDRHRVRLQETPVEEKPHPQSSKMVKRLEKHGQEALVEFISEYENYQSARGERVGVEGLNTLRNMLQRRHLEIMMVRDALALAQDVDYTALINLEDME